MNLPLSGYFQECNLNVRRSYNSILYISTFCSFPTQALIEAMILKIHAFLFSSVGHLNFKTAANIEHSC